MLPYYEIPPIKLGPLTIHPFGILVATAVLTGSWLANKRSRELRLDDEVTEQAAGWAVIPGFIVAHLYSALAYFPERVVAEPLTGIFTRPWPLPYILRVWDGISSFGGFVGGSIGVLYFLMRKTKGGSPWAYADSLMYGFAVAWIFGRLGCTVAFDHPGSLSDFFMAMPYPGDEELKAGIRHNLGFYEVFWAAAVSLLFYSQRKKAHFAGWYVAVFGMLYMPFRFALDFLRAVDKRYMTFTPAQFGAIALFLAAAYLFFVRRKTEPIQPIDDPGPRPLPPARASGNKARKR